MEGGREALTLMILLSSWSVMEGLNFFTSFLASCWLSSCSEDLRDHSCFSQLHTHTHTVKNHNTEVGGGAHCISMVGIQYSGVCGLVVCWEDAAASATHQSA